MIAKVRHRAHATQALAYTFRQGRWGSGEGPLEVLAGSFPPGTPRAQMACEFEQVRKLRPDCQKTVVHLTISFSDRDPLLADWKLSAIAQEYVEALGLEEGPWAASRHMDGRIAHLHVVASGINYLGHRVEMRGERFRTMRVSRRLEETYDCWRVSGLKGQPLRPPLSWEPVTGEAEPAPGKKRRPKQPALQQESPSWLDSVKAAINQLLKPGAVWTLPGFREALRGRGVELLPRFSDDGTAITGLGYRYRDRFAKGAELGFQLSALKKAGVSYDPVRDVPLLSTPGKPMGSALVRPSKSQSNPTSSSSSLESIHAHAFSAALRAHAPALSSAIWQALARAQRDDRPNRRITP